MFNLFKNIWEYLFFPWQIEIIEEGIERGWKQVDVFTDQERTFSRHFVKYKYTHRFRPQVKIVKKYLS